MGTPHEALRERLGRVGVWTFAFDGQPPARTAADVREIEELGYPCLWIPEGGGSNDVLTSLAWLLASSRGLTIASGIANMTARPPEVLARGAGFLTEAYEGRLVLGIGVGHAHTTELRGMDWADPVSRLRRYLDGMDEAAAGGPSAPRVLAALGDAMLRLAGERAIGAHTYFVPPEHTARARAVLGPDPVLAVEQGVIFARDATEARSIARGWASHYLELPNYARNWARLGFADDLEGGGSDRLVDAAFAWGEPGVVADRVRAQLDAGADHVCIQPISADGGACLAWLRELRPAVAGD